MSWITRTTLRRSILAAGGTLLAAGLSRKFLATDATAQPAPPPSPFQPLDVVRPHPPTRLPVLSFADATGQAQTLADHAGHGVVLNLWATWCMPCVAEMPSLDALARTLRPTGIQVLTVSLDHGGADAVRAFFAARAIRFLPILTDPHGTILAALGLDGIPATLLVDRTGSEVARLEGSVDWSTPDAARLVTRLLA